MFKLIPKSQATTRQIAENKIARNYVTKYLNPNVSLAVTEANNYHEKETTEYNRTYYLISGEMTLVFDTETVILQPEDVCYIEQDTTYEMKGTFKAVMVNQPAFGS